MDVLKLVTEEKREIDPKDPSRSKWFAVDPDVAYPETLKFFLEAKKNKDTANQIPEHYKARVLALSDDDIDLAGEPREEATAARRGEVLDLVRLVFTAILHDAVKQEPMGVHILKNEKWKL